MAAKAEAYLHDKNIPQLFESLMIALMYEQPDEPVTFITSCLAEVCDVGPASYEWGTFKQLIAQRNIDSTGMGGSQSTTEPLASEKSIKSTTNSNTEIEAKSSSAKSIQSTTDPQALVESTESATDPKASVENTELTTDPQTPVENTQSAPVESTQSATDPQTPVKAAKSATDPLVPVENTQSATSPQTPVESTQSATDPNPPIESTKSATDPQGTVESTQSVTDPQAPVESTKSTTDPHLAVEGTQSTTDPQALIEGTQSATDPQALVENTESSTSPKTENCSTEIGNRLVIFIMGGPGSGKGTQCSKIVEEFGFVHISAGDLLRGEVAKKTEQGQMIREIMERGELVPPEITVSLLRSELVSPANKEASGFIIDGFPRELSQYMIFKEQVCEGSVAIVFECSDEVMIERLTQRSETSGRVDDNPDTVKKRLVTHHLTTGPLIEHFEQQGKVRKVNAEMGVEEVYSDVQTLMKELKEPSTNLASEETTLNT